MPWQRTTARSFLVLALAASLAAASAFARGSTAAVSEPGVFPVVGEVHYTDDFGDPRGQGKHEGNDIMADRRAPAVAAEAGKVKLWTTSARAGCMLYLYGESGTTYLYVHLNNDLTKSNDNRGSCKPGVAYAPGLRDGDTVAAGQLIGFVGDSGDADGAGTHLHFERHPGGGAAVSPFPWLKKARSLLFPAPGGAEADQPVTITLAGTVKSLKERRLEIAVRRVKLSDGRWFKVARNATLTVPAGALVERAVGVAREAVTGVDAVKGESVVALTEPTQPVLEAQVAEPGVLKAAAIVLGRSSSA
jgi:hypothetical protein